MKIVGFDSGTGPHLGVVEGDQVIDLNATDSRLPNDLGAALRATDGNLAPLADLAKRAPASARRPLRGLTYALPVGHPGKVVCSGLNYLEHVKEGPNRDNIPKFPTIFLRCVTSLVAHEGRSYVRAPRSARLRGRADSRSRQAREAPDGGECDLLHCRLSCSNEGSVREFQRKTTQWDMGKNFDHTGGFGPWMVNAEELPPGAKGLKLESRLNGKVMQSDNTANMMFPVVEMLVYLTQGSRSSPATSSSPARRPASATRASPIRSGCSNGDVCEIDIEGVGTLRNPIVDQQC